MKETIDTSAIGTTAALSALIAYGLFSELSWALYPSFSEAKSLIAYLPFAREGGLLLGLVVLSIFSRWKSQSKRAFNRLTLFMVCGVCAFGLAAATIVKAGGIIAPSHASLFTATLFSTFFLVPLGALWWLVFVDLAENQRLPVLAIATLCSVAIFAFLAVLPLSAERLLIALLLPVIAWAPFGILGASDRVFLSNGDEGLTKSGTCNERESQKASCLRAAAGVGLIFLFSNLLLAVTPVSLTVDQSFGAVSSPGWITVVLLAGGSVVLLIVAGRRPISLRVLCHFGLVLASLGYLCFPFRPLGGFPLALGSVGRAAIMATLWLALSRLTTRPTAHLEGADHLKVFACAAFAVVAGSIVADVISLIAQMAPFYVDADFKSFTIISFAAIAVLIVFLIGYLPFLDEWALSEGVASDSPLTLEERCARLSQECNLTPRESEIVLLLARGRNIPFIESELVLSKSTVKTHIHHIYEKCNVSSRQELLSVIDEPGE